MSITPLQKHRGQNGVVAALFVLIAAVVVVLTTQPKAKDPVPDEPPRKLAVAAPAAAIPQVPDAPAPPAPVIGNRIVVDGVVAYDESRTARVVAPVHGWIADVPVKGKRVRAGQVLATVYSAEVFVAELELAAQARQFTTQEQLDVARRRLQRWRMPTQELVRVEKTGIARGVLPLVALRDGTLVEHEAVQGSFVEPRGLFTITDPAHVWVIAEVPEAAAARLENGMSATAKLGRGKVPVKVGYVARRCDSTCRVRFDLAAQVKPETMVPITIELPARKH